MLLSLCAQPISAQTVLSQWDRGSLSLRMSPALKPVIEPVLPKISAAMDRVSALMSQRSVSTPLTVWILKDQAERAAVLLQMGYPVTAQGKFVRSSDQVLVIASPQVDAAWLTRFIMGEYARYLLFSGARADGMEWYRTGLAISLGWFVVEEQDGGDWNSNTQRLTKYYKSRLAQSDVSLDDLLKPGNWNTMLATKDRTQILARSVLLSSWIAEKSGPAAGLGMLSLWERTAKLDEALLRGAERTIVQLKAQETLLNTGLPASSK